MLTHHANEASGRTCLDTHVRNAHSSSGKGAVPSFTVACRFQQALCVSGLSFMLRAEASAKKALGEDGPERGADTQPNSRD